MPTKEAKHVAEFPYKMILRHGCPLEIVSDQGREFCNQLVDLLEELTGFKHKITSAYHPQSNGLDERFNQTLKAQRQPNEATSPDLSKGEKIFSFPKEAEVWVQGSSLPVQGD